MIHLVIGGARSGKSRFAESLVKSIEVSQKNPIVTYIATATVEDEEMSSRINHHQKNRPPHWGLIEEAFYLGRLIKKLNQPENLLLIDCMTLWTSNWQCLTEEQASSWQQERECFMAALSTCKADIVIVTNEVGSGIIPMGHLSRKFVDQAGWLNQKLAGIASDVTLVVSGIPLGLKINGQYTENVRSER